MSTLHEQEIRQRGNLALLLQTATLFGKLENGTADKTEIAALALLTPLTKLFTTKDCLGLISEGLESFGGLGFQEDSNLPVYLRDAQVLAIQDGTTNVLSWEVVRALKGLGEQGLQDFLMWLRVKVDKSFRTSEAELRAEKDFGDAFRYLILIYTEVCNMMFDMTKGRGLKLKHEYNLRYAVKALAICVIGIILLDFSSVGDEVYEEEFFVKERNVATFIAWVRRQDFPSLGWFARVKEFNEEKLQVVKELAFSGLGEGFITDSKRPKF